MISIGFEKNTATPAGTEVNLGCIATEYRPVMGAFIGGTNHTGAFNISGYIHVRNTIALTANSKQYIRSVYEITH